MRARSPCPCRTRGAPGGALATRQHGVMGGLASWTLGGAAIQRLTERARHRTRREPRWISSNTSSGPDGRVLAHRSRHLFRRPTGCRGPPPHARLHRRGWQRRERIREGHRRRDGHEAINEAARKATQQPHPACSVTDSEPEADLEPGRKELLLPLDDESAMRRAAQHVTAMKLTQRATRTYVASQRAEQRSRACGERRVAAARALGRHEGRTRRARRRAQATRSPPRVERRHAREAPEVGGDPPLENHLGASARDEGACEARGSRERLPRHPRPFASRSGLTPSGRLCTLVVR